MAAVAAISMRQPLVDGQPVAGQSLELLRVVAHQAHGADAEVAQHLERGAIVPQIGREAEPLVRLDRVGAFVLQLVGANLVGEADAAAFLVEVNQHASPFVSDAAQCFVQLRAAIAARRMEDVAGHAR